MSPMEITPTFSAPGVAIVLLNGTTVVVDFNEIVLLIVTAGEPTDWLLPGQDTIDQCIEA